jgi:TPR repeat protein
MCADDSWPRSGGAAVAVRFASRARIALAIASLAIGLIASPMVLAQEAAATPPAAQEPVPDLETLLALAGQGHPVAQFNLGVKYDFGQGVDKDPAQAIRWYRLAAAQGHGGAQFNLGGMYFEGLGVKRDLLRATMWFTLSAEAGVSGAAKNRAILARAMSPEQQAQARTMALECRQRAFKDCEP